jgi:hypothetical protein
LIPNFSSPIHRTDIGPYQKGSYTCNYSEENKFYLNYTLYQTSSEISWVANIELPLWTNITMPTAQSIVRADVTSFSNFNYGPNIFWFEGSNDGILYEYQFQLHFQV